MEGETISQVGQPLSFKAETRQLLDILIHSLYTEREVFLRELISNASDALTRMHFESLTNREVLDPQAELGIWISTDEEHKTLTIADSGLGMSASEMIENLGTIAHSGAKAFLDAAKSGNQPLSDIIGQFGVGFYSAFMVARKIEVLSRSYLPEEKAARWVSEGEDTYIIEPVENKERGTTVIIHLKEDAENFLQEHTLRQIIHTHSDYIPYPIYLGDGKEPVNRQTALWRQSPQQVTEDQYKDFYRQFSLDLADPILKIHLSIDAPVQLYALLFVPSTSERGIFGLRKEDGLKLYARKVLIQEYCKDLLPPYLRFVDGVVDSEDLPLNVSRETIQSSRVIAQLKKLLTNKVIDLLSNLGKETPEDYANFWSQHGRAIREGIATDAEFGTNLTPLLRFHTHKHPAEWVSLEQYTLEMPASQTKIYYLLGDDERALASSPHLETVSSLGYDVLFMADPIDPFMLIRLTTFEDRDIVNLASEAPDIDTPTDAEKDESNQDIPPDASNSLVARFKRVLGDRIAEVRTTNRLTDSPARLIDQQSELKPELQRVYRLLNKEFEPPKQVLEINPNHPILTQVASLPDENELSQLVIEQIYENALLIEGIPGDPAAMARRILVLMKAALTSQVEHPDA
jgi:molecular chaperone HtpG